LIFRNGHGGSGNPMRRMGSERNQCDLRCPKFSQAAKIQPFAIAVQTFLSVSFSTDCQHVRDGGDVRRTESSSRRQGIPKLSASGSVRISSKIKFAKAIGRMSVPCPHPASPGTIAYSLDQSLFRNSAFPAEGISAA